MKERIKELRDTVGLTQKKFAERLGLKRQTIAAYEAGNIQPSGATILLICKEFNINESWLRTGEGEMKVETNKRHYTLDLEKLKKVDNATIIRWINVIAETNPKVLVEIEKIIKNLLENEDES